jgi:predicted short-subunit dehydrogenase-like oxidoreductase (DUF2520 family)
MDLDKKPGIVFIGAGNLATNLAVALFNSYYQILQVYSRSEKSAMELAAKVKSSYTTEISKIVSDGDIYFISVPDKAIQGIADSLNIKRGIVVHTSGSTDIQILSRFKANGYGVFYPFQTFSKSRIIPFNDIPICLNADCDKTYSQLNRIALMISNKVARLDSQTLTWLHLAGVFVNNFTNHLLVVSKQISQEKNFDFELLKPLVEETVKKAFEGNPQAAQTGPAVRFDQNTINLHIEKLKEYSPELAEIYKALTLSIQSLSNKN